jgi:hypothetical protein
MGLVMSVTPFFSGLKKTNLCPIDFGIDFEIPFFCQNKRNQEI